MAGKVREILCAADYLVKFIAIQVFSIGHALHPLVHLPVLELTNDECVLSDFKVQQLSLT